MKAECESCGASDVECTSRQVGPPLSPPAVEKVGDRRTMLMCGLCCEAGIDHFTAYPSQHDHDAIALAQLAGRVGNAILREMRRIEGEALFRAGGKG